MKKLKWLVTILIVTMWTDPIGADEGKYRMTRGRHWLSTAYDAIVTKRGGLTPASRTHTEGFRVARSIK